MADINWGSITTLYESASYNLRCCQINDYLLAVVYRVGTNQYIDIIEFDLIGDYEILSHNLTSSSLSGINDNVQACCKVTTNKFLVVCKTTHIIAHLFYWDGSTLTDYGDDLGSAADSDYHSLTQIEDNKIMLFYRTSASSMSVRVATCNDGVSLTWSGATTLYAYSSSFIASTKIDSGKVLVASRHIAADDLEVRVVSSPAGLDDRSINYGSVYDIETTKETYFVSTHSYETDKAVVCYGLNGISGGYAVACTISGTVVTIGTIKEFEGGETLNTSVCKCLDVENAFLVAYEDANDSNKGKTEELIVDWNTRVITLGTTQLFSENSTGGGFTNYALHIIDTDNDKYFIGFADITDSGYPKCVMDYAPPGPPEPPVGISVESGDVSNIISFSDSTDVDSYNLYWDTTSGVTVGTGIKISDITPPYIHHWLDPELTYYYILTSEDEYGEGDPSAIYSSSPTPRHPRYITSESAIESIIISWTDSTGADQYNLYWDTTSGLTIETGTKITDVTSPYTHSGLTPGQTIYYILTAEDEDGESEASGEFNEIVGIDIPQNPSAVNSESRGITITWDSVNGATHYNIYWLKTPGVTKEIGNKISSVTSPYRHRHLDGDDTYYYVITAENATVEGDESDEVNAIAYILPQIPTNVDATASLYSVIVSWDTTEEQDFNLYWDTTTGVTIGTGNLIEDVTSPYTHYTPSHLIPFYYVVTGVIGVFESSESSEVNATPYIDPFAYPDQERVMDGFSDNRFSSVMNRVMKMATIEDIVLFPGQTFKFTVDSTSEVTIGEGIFIKDNMIVHVQESFTLDFSNNDYYIDSTGNMEEEGYYYIVAKYEYKRQRPGPKASYHIIRDTYLYDSSIHIFLGTAEIINNGGVFIVSRVFTYDPLDVSIKRPTITSEPTMIIDAGEL